MMMSQSCDEALKACGFPICLERKASTYPSSSSSERLSEVRDQADVSEEEEPRHKRPKTPHGAAEMVIGQHSNSAADRALKAKQERERRGKMNHK
jgi:hypothetical protein